MFQGFDILCTRFLHQFDGPFLLLQSLLIVTSQIEYPGVCVDVGGVVGLLAAE